jgi:hypothetical protein
LKVLTRPGYRPQQRSRSRTRKILQRPRIWLIGGGGLILSALVLSGLYGFERAIGLQPNQLLFAFLGGCFVTSVVWAMWSAAFTMGGGAAAAAGAEAERWTAAALADLGSKWKTYHGLLFHWGRWGGRTVDIDHVAIGPYGMLVVETKFRTGPIDLNAGKLSPEVTRAVHQAEGNAKRIEALLARDVSDMPVVPVVIWWGPAIVGSVDPVRKQGDVRLVRGADAKHWLPLLSSGRVSQDAIDRASRKLGSHASKTGS